MFCLFEFCSDNLDLDEVVVVVTVVVVIVVLGRFGITKRSVLGIVLYNDVVDEVVVADLVDVIDCFRDCCDRFSDLQVGPTVIRFRAG